MAHELVVYKRRASRHPVRSSARRPLLLAGAAVLWIVAYRVNLRWWDWVVYGGEPHGWYHWRPDSVQQSLEIMSQMFDFHVAGRDHDVKATAATQREGVELARNPSIDLWNSLVNGRP